MAERAAIILSGGKAERFQKEKGTWQDKALIELEGKPLLVHAVESVQNHVDETVVVANDEKRLTKYSRILAKHGITGVNLVTDIKIDHLGGPLVAIYTGLEAAKADRCLTLPCDMPLVQPKVVEHLFASAKNSLATVPMWPNGRLETLVMILERKSILEISQTLCLLKRPRSDDIVRGALRVLFLSIVAEIQKLDPELKSFVNINAPEDLINLQPRRGKGSLANNLLLDLGALPMKELKLLKEAAESAKADRVKEAADIFASAGKRFERKALFFWAAISRENEAKTLRQQMKQQREPKQVAIYAAKAHEAFLRAADSYRLESEIYEKNRNVFPAERAKSDKTWCESRAAEITVQKQDYGR